MTLGGAGLDRDHTTQWAETSFEEIELETFENATLDDIKTQLTSEATRDVAMLLICFHGHGIRSRYITADGYIKGTVVLQGLRHVVFQDLLAQSNPSTWKFIVGDFCEMGNYPALRYTFSINEHGVEWIENDLWRPYEGHKPIVCLAASAADGPAYELREIGGALTKGLTRLGGKPLTLTELVVEIRQYVGDALRKGSEARHQTINLYCNFKLPQNEPNFLYKFHTQELRY